MTRAAAFAAALCCVFAAAAGAQQAAGSLTVTAVVQGSIGLRVQGTSDAAADSASARVDENTSAVRIEVVRANLPQTSLAVLASLETEPADGTTWFINGMRVSQSIPATLHLDSGSSIVTLQITAHPRHGAPAANRVVFVAHAE